MARKSDNQTAIPESVDTFIRQINSLKDSLPIAMTAIQASHRHAHTTFDDFVQQECEKLTKEGKTAFLVPTPLVSRFAKLSHELSKSFSAYDIVARSFLVSLVSQYDAFLGRLTRALIETAPHVLSKTEDGKNDNRTDRYLSYTDLLAFTSIEDAKEQMVSEAIDGLLRKSHKEQFVWLESKFGLPLRKDLPAWPHFIEVTQRRNLFVHCDGIVSKQYLLKCQEDKVLFSDQPKLGDELSLDPIYFHKAHDVLFEIGVKLSQVLWRKVRPSEVKKADSQLNRISYELIREEEYDLAITILDFACEV